MSAYFNTIFFGVHNISSMKIICTHHKTGTALFAKIFMEVCDKLNLNFFYGTQDKLPKNTNVWMQDHSLIDFEKLKKQKVDYVGVHVIRHPMQVILSSYEYHKICPEKWCAKEKNKQFDNLTYQEKINTFNKNDGIIFEMEHCSKATIMDMYKWNYENDKMLNVKYEDIMSFFDHHFLKIFMHLKFNSNKLQMLLDIAKNYNINSMSQQQLKDDPHITNKSLKLDSYKDELTNEHMNRFKEIFPSDLMQKLTYHVPVFKHIENGRRLRRRSKWPMLLFAQRKMVRILFEDQLNSLIRQVIKSRSRKRR